MAGYSIVLNLNGNAVKRAEALATALGAANANAAALTGNLRAAGAAAQAMPSRPLRVTSPGRANVARNGVPGYSGETFRQDPRYTRHSHTRIASWGYGFNMGGFSGRLSSVMQPDSNGKLLGMNAGTLMKSVNIAGIATNILSGIGKTLLKVTAYSTLAPLAIGGGGMMIALKALQSEGFAEGVRLISRRHQAKMGLGADYEQANSNADYIAQSYGFDRSTSLSSINVLTGLGVGGKDRRVSLGEATGLTKVGGLISQHAGVSFERVMTNIQQLLVQATPNIRDIRELLNQAPVLGKYALREMDSKGVKGMDVRTYLKDQSNLLSVLKRYELDNASNAGMQARGQIALAQQDFWAKIASNDKFWSMVGNRGSGIIGSAANGINNLMTTLENSPEFNVMLRNIENTFDNFADGGVKFIDKLINLIDGVASKWGIDLGDKRGAKLSNDKSEAIQYAIADPSISSKIRERWEASTLPVSTDPITRNEEFKRFQTDFLRAADNDRTLRGSIEGSIPLNATSDITGFWNHVNPSNWYAGERFERENTWKAVKAKNDYMNGGFRSDSTLNYRPTWANGKEPSSAFASYTVKNSAILSSLDKYIGSTGKIGTLDPSLFKPNGAGENGKDLSGFNSDRKALVINFNDKLVEWNSTFTTNNPQEMVDNVSENMDEVVSAAIQKAMLGATNKMSSQW